MRIATTASLRRHRLFARRASFTTPALLVISLALGGLAYPAFQGEAKMRPQRAYPLADGLSSNGKVTARRQQRTSPTVFVSLSSRGTRAATTFALHGQNQRIYCLVRNSALPVYAVLLFQWSQGSPPPFFTFPENRAPGQFSDVYYTVSPAGRYRCDVSVNGRPVGSARFTVTPQLSLIANTDRRSGQGVLGLSAMLVLMPDNRDNIGLVAGRTPVRLSPRQESGETRRVWNS